MKQLLFETNYTESSKIEATNKVVSLKLDGYDYVKSVPDSILLTREQFNELRAKIAGDAFDAGKRWAKNEYKETFVWNKKEENPFPDKQQYLLSINSKENE